MWIYNTSTARQYRSGGFETPPSVAFLPEERIRKGVRRYSHHSPLASSFVRGMRTVPRERCRLRQGVGPFNFSNKRRATRRGTGEMIVGNMRETFTSLPSFFSSFSHSKQAQATPLLSPLRRIYFFCSVFLSLCLLLSLVFRLYIVLASALQRNLFTIL